MKETSSRSITTVATPLHLAFHIVAFVVVDLCPLLLALVLLLRLPIYQPPWCLLNRGPCLRQAQKNWLTTRLQSISFLKRFACFARPCGREQCATESIVALGPSWLYGDASPSSGQRQGSRALARQLQQRQAMIGIVGRYIRFQSGRGTERRSRSLEIAGTERSAASRFESGSTVLRLEVG